MIALLAGAGGFLVWFNHEAVLTVSGKEYPPRETEAWLRQQLESHFHWAGLPGNGLEKVWIEGFQDHTSLYRIRLSPEQFADLQRAVLASKAEGVKLDDGDDLKLCPRGFGTSSPQGPKGLKIPEWWDVTSLRSVEGLLWKSTREGYWFGYDRESGVLYLLGYDT
ncbi:hypothetical protein [Luteolibacter soli]|uniref:Uncharacterized protein n=1 Tax=Luteolibacter soli TaxID=3135280 RepID=A0ABU9AVY4_9BACT